MAIKKADKTPQKYIFKCPHNPGPRAKDRCGFWQQGHLMPYRKTIECIFCRRVYKVKEMKASGNLSVGENASVKPVERKRTKKHPPDKGGNNRR